MIEIIPNWHPIFVHFTVALFSATVFFYALSYFLSKCGLLLKVASDFEIVGKWCLWVVGFMVIGTVLAGFNAYNTVNHDAPSHIAMTDHRNWAIPTAIAIVLLTIWSFWRSYKHKAITITFILALLVTQGLLLSTAWRGAELVFRYGLGVMSMPKSEGEGHHHHHEGETDANEMHDMDLPSTHH